MARHGKNYRNASTDIEEDVFVEAPEAIERVREMAFAKFDETIDVAVRLGVDPRHADQIVRGTVILPAGTGRTVRVLALAQGDKAREAEEAGADFVGKEFIEKIEGLARLRRGNCDTRSDEGCGEARSCARTARTHADTQGRNGHDGCRTCRAGGESREDRVPGR